MTDLSQSGVSRRRSLERKFLETVVGERCPCGHLRQRHRKSGNEIPGEVMGACRDCGCRGLIDYTREQDA